MKGICYIVGAAIDAEIGIIVEPEDYVIAADGGYNALLLAGIKPDMIIGDFDSLDDDIEEFEVGIQIERYPVKKDDTDVMLAVKEGIKRGYRKYVLFGVLGGRIDHTLANIQLLAYMSKQGLEAELVGKESVITAVTNGEIHFDKRSDGMVSVFSHDSYAYGVTIKGFMYEVEDVTLSNEVPLGVSNEFIGKKSFVSVKDGTLIIVYEK